MPGGIKPLTGIKSGVIVEEPKKLKLFEIIKP